MEKRRESQDPLLTGFLLSTITHLRTDFCGDSIGWGEMVVCLTAGSPTLPITRPVVGRRNAIHRAGADELASHADQSIRVFFSVVVFIIVLGPTKNHHAAQEL